MNFALRRLVTANPIANACKVAAALVCLLLSARSAIAPAPVPFPKEVNLVDAFCRQQILVSSGSSDVTRSSQYQSTNPSIFTVDATGYITPAGDGKAELIIKAPGGQVRVPVSVQGMTKQREVDFRNEILPILSRHGCNSGGCHGKASGQNGFKLSLFGFDAEFDYDQLVKQARGRRVNSSELLNKACFCSKRLANCHMVAVDALNPIASRTISSSSGSPGACIRILLRHHRLLAYRLSLGNAFSPSRAISN
ncbi:MAG: hypothetical protein U0894_12280 [Pirellulales bacterium]